MGGAELEERSASRLNGQQAGATAQHMPAVPADGEAGPATSVKPTLEREEEDSKADATTGADGGQCGVLCCAPSFLQPFNKPRWALFFICLFVIFESMTISGLTSSVLPAIEKRFRLTSQQSGFILSAYEIAAVVVVLPVGYFGDWAHKPRWVGLGAALFGVGSLIFALPQALQEQYSGSNRRLEVCGPSVNHSLYETDVSADTESMYILLIIGQVLLGFSAAPLYTVGLTFLDEIANPKNLHIYIGLFYVSATLGPALGFILGGAFLDQYVDPGVENTLETTDPNFVGRWWAGHVVTGCCGLLVSVPLLMFPKQLPKTAWIMEEKRKSITGTGASKGTDNVDFGRTPSVGSDPQNNTPTGRMKRLFHEFVVMLKVILAIFMTPVLLANTIGVSSESFAVSGVVPFLTKYFETQFSLTSSSASLLTGAATIVGVMGGVIFGSWLMKYRSVSGPRLAKYTAAIALIALFFMTAFLVRCTPAPIIGVSQAYPESTVTGSDRCQLNYTSACVASCGCVSERYDPVCGADKRTYLTPCLAGCRDYRNATSGKVNDRTYTDCSCVASNLTAAAMDGSRNNATATPGRCEISCTLLPLFVVLLLCAMFFTFMNNVPAVEVVLQSVPAGRRTVATSVQLVIVRLLGNIPGPVFYGYLLDRDCQLWQLERCDRGNCWEYDSAHMSYSLFGASAVCKFISMVAFFLSWRYFLRDVRVSKSTSSAADSEMMSPSALQSPTETDGLTGGALANFQC